jgi:hypothetical protein
MSDPMQVMITPNPCSAIIGEKGILDAAMCPTPIPTPFAGPNETWCVAKEAFSLVVLKQDAMMVAALCFVVGFLWCLILIWLYLKYRKEDNDGSS